MKKRDINTMFQSFTLGVVLLATGLCSFSMPASAQTVRVRCCNSSSTPSFREVYEYDYVSDKPTFPGGTDKMVGFINQTRSYPADAYRKHIQGRVTVSFVVNADGKVSDVSVMRGVEPSLDAEACRVITAMPSWSPGRLNGRPVPVRVIQVIPFRL